MANKPSPIKAEYMKQRKRVQGMVRRAEKQGFTVPENFIPDIPKTITQGSINRLAKLTPEKLYTKSTIEVERTDKQGNTVKKTISAAQYRKQKKSTPKKNTTTSNKGKTNTRNKSARQKTKIPTKKAPTPQEQQLQQEIERELTLEDRYAEVQEAIDRNTVPDWLTDDLAQTYGYLTAKEMWDDSWENEDTKKTVEVLETAFANQAKKAPSGYTDSDREFQSNYTARDLSDDVEFQEDTITLKRVQQLIDSYSDSLGGNLLNTVMSNSIARYGEHNVAGALAVLEDQNPRLMSQLQNLIFYPQFNHDSGMAGRAFKSLASAIRMYDSHDDGAFNKALGDAMEALQYYDDIR